MTGHNWDFSEEIQTQRWSWNVVSDWRYSQGCVLTHNPDWHRVSGIDGKFCLRLSYLHTCLFYKVFPGFLVLAYMPINFFLPVLTPSFYRCPASLSTILTLLIFNPRRPGFSWDETHWWLLEFINRCISLNVIQRWAIKLSMRKLSELRSTGDERCFKDV